MGGGNHGFFYDAKMKTVCRHAFSSVGDEWEVGIHAVSWCVLAGGVGSCSVLLSYHVLYVTPALIFFKAIT